MTSQEIANQLETSSTSIIRLSKKVTSGGFNELKTRLSKFLPKEVTQYNVELVDNESTISLKNKLHSRSKAALSNANETLNAAIIDEICDLIKNSETIFIYGYGASFVVATDLYQKLSRIGLNIQLVHETHIFTTMLATRNSNDCVIFISNNGTQSEMQSIAKAKQSNIVLTYGQTDENEMRMGATTSLFAQMFTIDILYYRYIALNYQSSLDFITQSKIALDNYRKHLSNIDFKH